ncbi:SDR family NAD(P)-dependent oxidoreductase, partial [Mesorhizobium sp. M2C.T.Ca.TU.009.01.2.1]
MGRVAGKVALVTGAGLGLGRASSLLLASEGARLVVSDIDEGLAANTAAEIVKAGGEALALRHDVSKPED